MIPTMPWYGCCTAIAPKCDGTEKKPRNKVALKPGHSLMDWVRLSHSGVDLTGVGGVLQDVTPKQLAAHSKKNDAWIAIKGRVYNVTHYMNFHPGGDTELMRGVGQDGTTLFSQIHPWVNFESLLQKCLVGHLVSHESTGASPVLNKATRLIGKLFTKRDPQEKTVSMKWFQQLATVSLQFFTRGDFPQTRVMLFKSHRDLTVNLKLGNVIHTTHVLLEDSALWPCKVRTNYESGVVEVCLTKASPNMWHRLGEPQEDDGQKKEMLEQLYDPMEVVSVSSVTHNTKLIVLRHKHNIMDTIPIGCSVPVLANIDGVDVVRCYTPVTAALDEKFLPPGWSEDCLCLMVKQYPEGLMSRFLCSLKLQDTVNVGQASGSLKLSMMGGRTKLCLMAAGSGFTPMVKLIIWALSAGNKKKFQEVCLLFFNMTSRDILWQDQLDRLAATDARFSAAYVLTAPDDDWSGLTGHLNLEMLQTVVPSFIEQKTHDTFVCVCGPDSFRESAMRLLGDMGYPEDFYFVFQG
ncbi:cytochrome b5 reductase 4 isoform X2 [Zootermopsis nevadensis]|uniref:cytochrome b5 reductase 4 isoform X2 n=1 Tax=Zootermopsis nevadensis TaxID=136037 RepID=UPI000B8EBC3E|nr:cytochrome b5 reductase 4 isoform X2 [Zootermopsis nevadensis]XP_021936787.1 cytochrome b5 reductase 4 isoform X2 [Zootermopsis nevadensis]